MSNTIVILDTGVLGLLINSEPSTGNEVEVKECNKWLDRLLAQEILVTISEIADYEERRELIRRRNKNCLQRLEDIRSRTRYYEITTEIMLKAADIWAKARQKGQSTADNKALDGDAIIAAQAVIAKAAGMYIEVATTDTKDLNRLLAPYFITAKRWKDIII